MIKIDFEFQTIHGTFRDALYLPEDHNFTDAEIQSMKEGRRDDWLNLVNRTTPRPEIISIDGVNYEKVEIDGQFLLKPIAA